MDVAGLEPNPSECYTQILKQHQHCGYWLSVGEHGKPDVVRYDLKWEPDVMESLINKIETLSKEFYAEKRKHYTFSATNISKRRDAFVKNSWLKTMRLYSISVTILTSFLGGSQCKVNLITLNFVPVIAHNLTIYGLQCNLRAPTKASPITSFPWFPALKKITYFWLSRYGSERLRESTNKLWENAFHRFVSSHSFIFVNNASEITSGYYWNDERVFYKKNI